MIFDSAGRVLTNEHVVRGGRSLKVVLPEKLSDRERELFEQLREEREKEREEKIPA